MKNRKLIALLALAPLAFTFKANAQVTSVKTVSYQPDTSLLKTTPMAKTTGSNYNFAKPAVTNTVNPQSVVVAVATVSYSPVMNIQVSPSTPQPASSIQYTPIAPTTGKSVIITSPGGTQSVINGNGQVFRKN